MFISDNGNEYIPRRATEHSAGYDFYATEDIVIKAGEWTKFDTHIRIAPKSLHPDQVLLLMPRSSTGFKYGFRLRNTIGVIDADYTDNIHASVTADVDLTIKKGDRYMQGIIVGWAKMDGEIEPQVERNGGIGSTGE